jgi:opacity protein-like surface antigen
MNVRTTKLTIITIISLLVFTMTASFCSAQEYSRKGKTELFGTIQGMSSEEVVYPFTNILPVKLDIDSTTVYGVGYGQNLTDHWNFNMDLLFGYADTDVKIVHDVIDVKVGSVEMDYILWDINFDYNIFKSRFTPLVTGGIGLMDFSINTKATGVGEVNDTSFSSNLGAGVRWDVTDYLLLKVIYRSTWTEFSDADEDQRYEGVNFSVAYMF